MNLLTLACRNMRLELGKTWPRMFEARLLLRSTKVLEVTYPHCLLGFRLLLAFSITVVSYMVVVMVIADLRAPVAPPPRPGTEVPSRKYTLVLDLNGVLLHRTYDHGKYCVQVRPGVTAFLNWLQGKGKCCFLE